MKFKYSKQGLTGKERLLQRTLEMLPGILSWTTLLTLIIISIIKPLQAMMIVIAFDFYWFLRLIYMTLFLVISFARLKIESKSDWLGLIREIDQLKHGSQPGVSALRLGMRQRLSDYLHKKDLELLRQSHSLPPVSKEIYHLVILPVATESKDVLVPSIESLRTQKFPSKQLVVIIALEARAPRQVRKELLALEKTYKEIFLDFSIVIHPEDIPGEAKVKGANVTWAARKAVTFFQKRRTPLENITVSCFDADTIVGPDYFACLTYYFMVTPSRLQSSFQPIPVFHNNIWEVPGFARVMETGSSFFQLIESTNPEKLVTFSSHSMSFKALVDVNFWPVDLISDDSAIFWKSFIHYDGRFSVVPMYTTISMDITVSDNFFGTLKSIYKQKRRWAWGVENFPIVTRAFLKSKEISLYQKARHGFKLLEGHVSWATWGFILTILSWLPTFLARKELMSSVVYYNAPYISGIIFNLASISLIISIVLSIFLLPKTKVRHSFLKKLLFASQWLLMPFILVFLSALPALDAQTRMLFGKGLDFWVAHKRKS